MRAPRTGRSGRLQQMTALDATATLTTAADMHVETAHVRLHDRQIFLDLDRHARFGDATAAVRTLVRKRNVNDLIEGGGRLTMTMATVAPTSSTAGWSRMRLRHSTRGRADRAGKVAALLGDWFGLHVRPSAVTHALHRAARQAGPTYVALREQVRGSPVVAPDE
jgi:hypothetical protein